ncbi:MAG: hypothetical protein LBK08_11675 [Treponema sp.]|jgi:hypothetical protein|nr:hypothetical protein [Treponema sp.]
MTKEVSLKWEVYDYEPVKNIVPEKGAITVVRDPSLVVAGKVMVNLVVGDGEHTIEELRGNTGMDISLIQSNMAIVMGIFNDLIGSDGKIKMSKLPGVIMGQMIFGGEFDTDGKIISSSYAPELNGMQIEDVNTADYPEYYFISLGNYTLLTDEYVNGDWAVCQGDHAPAWVKVDNTEAVSSVNGKTGAVTLAPGDLGMGNVLSDIITLKAQMAALTEKTLYAKLG